VYRPGSIARRCSELDYSACSSVRVRETAYDLANRGAYKATAGVYGALKSQLSASPYKVFQLISAGYSRPTKRQPKVKLQGASGGSFVGSIEWGPISGRLPI
jgi:hypothetical protein